MKIGLGFLTQIRSGDDPQTIYGFIVQTFNQVVSGVTAGYHVEHTPDDGHATIHATGAIYERGRTMAMGEWTDVTPFLASNFFGGNLMTWTVTAAQVELYRYMQIGKTVTIAVEFVATTQGGTAYNQFVFTIPLGLKAARVMRNQVSINDNGTIVAGHLSTIGLNSPFLVIQRNDFANFSAAGTLTVRGETTFEVV